MTAIAMHLPPTLETSPDARPATIKSMLKRVGGGSTATTIDPQALVESELFLWLLVDDGYIGRAVAEEAAKQLQVIFREIPGLGAPRIGAGPDGMVGLTWENAAHHVNIEIFSDGHVEFFSEDLGSGDLWGEETPKAGKPSAATLAKLKKTL